MNETGNREEHLFNEAMQLPTAEARAAFLKEACGGDEQLRQRVEALLRAAQPTNDFLEKPAARGKQKVESREQKSPGATILISPESLPVSEKPGDRIGHYKLLEQIGEGGCGVVYMAEQTEPIRRRVAFKVIKLGMDTKSVVARFEAERQALALMDHPNIAKVLDAGATETGRPYFVMELVKGIKITEFCQQNQLSTKERLELFMQVCHAVQHAHQKGIIHRDIKPSNILVTLHDGVPVPKVIDFGIAKATQQPLTDKTMFTAFQQFIGTPAYMSPEQAELSGLDIDTRTDIYALGVLLYELLVGKPPFEPETLLKAGLDEMRRIIRETEPVKPSTKLAGGMPAKDAKDTKEAGGAGRAPAESETANRKSQIERASVRRLVQEVRGDLDWIVMKCLEKDRRRRYETANGLAHDIERHLNNEPVTAGAPSRLYKMRKFMRRHRFGLATAASLVLILLMALVVTSCQSIRTQRAQCRTQLQSKFLEAFVMGVQSAMETEQDAVLLIEVLDKAAARLENGFADRSQVSAHLYQYLGASYGQLEQYARAETMFRQALPLHRQYCGSKAPCVGGTLYMLGGTSWEQGKLAQAETYYREALAFWKKRHVNKAAEIAQVQQDLGKMLGNQSRYSEAEALFREALGIREKLQGSGHIAVSESLDWLAYVLREQNKLTESEAFYRKELAFQKQFYGAEHEDVAEALANLGWVLKLQGKFEEAEALEREALAMRRNLLSPDHVDIATSLNDLGVVLTDQGRLQEAESQHRQALAMRRKLLGNEHDDVAHSLGKLAFILWKQERYAESEAAYRELLALHRKKHGDGHPDVASALRDVAITLGAQNKLSEAEAFWREALAMQKKLHGAENATVARSLYDLAAALEKQDKLNEAETLEREALAMRRKLLGTEHTDIALSLHDLGIVLRKQGRLAEAEVLFREAVAMRKKLLGPDHGDVNASLRWLGHVLRQQGRLAEAETALREALNIQTKLNAKDSDWVWTVDSLASVLWTQGRCADAEALYRELGALYRNQYGNEHTNVATTLRNVGGTLRDRNRFAEAEALYRECLSIQRKQLPSEDPGIARTLANLGYVLRRQGKWTDAGVAYREAVKADDAEAQAGLGWLCAHGHGVARDDTAAAGWYRQAVEQHRKKAEKGDYREQLGIAWLLATCPVAEIRDGPRAVAYADGAYGLTNRSNPWKLETLAAAYAEAGQFDQAVSTEREAIALLKDEEVKSDFTARLRLYEAKTPYREE